MGSSKRCFKCLLDKPLSCFYKHPQMGDGHLNKCKECTKGDVKRHRAENLDRVRSYDRDRAKDPLRKKLAAAICKRWRQEDRRRTAAHNAVARAIRSGKIIMEDCISCGSPDSVAHHHDYDRKLDVVWLCQPCHCRLHADIIAGNKKPPVVQAGG